MVYAVKDGIIPHLCRLQRITVNGDVVRAVALARRSGWTESLGFVCHILPAKDHTWAVDGIIMELDETLATAMSYTDRDFTDPDEDGTR